MKARQTSKYYTAKEAQKILGMTYSALRHQVTIGNLKSIVPPSGKQAVYPKNDVDKLANQLNAFFNIENEENKEESIFGLGTKEDLAEIQKIGIALFAPNSNIKPGVPEWWIKALNKNPNILFTLKKGDQILGYVSTVPFKPNNEKTQKCLEVESLRDVNITPDDIETFEAGRHIHLYIIAIAINPELSGIERKNQGAKLIGRFISEIVELGKRGVVIEKITARGDTKSGIKLLQAFGFSEILPPAPDKRAFAIEIEKSGAPAILQYKQALYESGTLDSKILTS